MTTLSKLYKPFVLIKLKAVKPVNNWDVVLDDVLKPKLAFQKRCLSQAYNPRKENQLGSYANLEPFDKLTDITIPQSFFWKCMRIQTIYIFLTLQQ